MQFSDESIDKLIEIYEKRFKERLNREDAVAMGNRLVEFYKLVLRPRPEQPQQEGDGVAPVFTRL